MSAVLVDTSVWRGHFRGVSSARGLGAMLDEDDVVHAHPWVIAELVLGGLARRDEALLARLPQIPLVPDREVLELVRRRRLARRGIGWVDAHLIAGALVSATALWTLDGPLAAAAEACGVQLAGA